MPQIEVYNSATSNEIIFKPDNGDVRYRDFGALEQWQNGNWSYLGDLRELFDSLPSLKMDRDRMLRWIEEEEAKKDFADELEGKFDDLAKAGEHLRQLEAMLRVARKTYASLTDDVKERLKTFERLDTPYPDDEPA